jgi:small nuclear ribonucleoprotein F
LIRSEQVEYHVSLDLPSVYELHFAPCATLELLRTASRLAINISNSSSTDRSTSNMSVRRISAPSIVLKVANLSPQFVPLNPRPMLQSLYVFPSTNPRLHHATNILPFFRVNEEVVVRLKWGETEYSGRLVSVDSYMNIQLSGAEEHVKGKSTGSLGQVLIRYVKT